MTGQFNNPDRVLKNFWPIILKNFHQFQTSSHTNLCVVVKFMYFRGRKNQRMPVYWLIAQMPAMVGTRPHWTWELNPGLRGGWRSPVYP